MTKDKKPPGSADRGAKSGPNKLNERLMYAGFLPEPRDRVFDVQLAALEFNNSQIVGRRMCQCFTNFLFQCPVTFLEFRKMRFDRHLAASLR
jgi:hypothetical protein